MSKKIMALALLIGWSGLPAHADTQASQLTWQATASKDTRMEISLTHPGHQYVNSGPTLHPVHTLAADISHPEFNATYQLQARKLYGKLSQPDGNPLNLTLNGQPLSATHPLTLTQATRYYLSYQATAAKPDQVGEAAYELMVYWLG